MPSEIHQKVADKQLDLLYRQLPLSLLGSTALSLLLFFFLYDFPDKNVLRIWLTLTILVVVFRASSTVLYQKAKKQS